MERLGDEERLWEGLQEPSGRSCNQKGLPPCKRWGGR